LYWHSDSSIVSSSVSIRWQGSSSRLSSHRHWFDVDEDVFVLTDRDDSGVTIIVIAVCVPVGVLIIVIIVVCCYCRRRRKRELELQQELNDIPEAEEADNSRVYATPTITIPPAGRSAPQSPPGEVFGYQAPQLVSAAEGYPSVYFPVDGYPYSLSGMYPPRPAEWPYQRPAGTDGPQ
jgi:hypothetical protein